MKRNSLCFVSEWAGFEALAPGMVAFAEFEDFPGHALAVKGRSCR